MGVELPCLLQERHPPGTSTCLPTQKLSEPSHVEFLFLWRFYYAGMID